MADRTYTEEEVAALLERTAELQRQTARRDPHEQGLSLSELEAIAADVGLDPTLLRQAASEMDTPEDQRGEAGVGTTATHNYVERWLPGELTDDVWEEVVMELRHRYESSLYESMAGSGMSSGFGSRTEQIGRTREWRHTSASGIETRVMLRPKDNGVRMRLSQRVGMASTITESVMYGGILALFISFVTYASTDALNIGVAMLMATLAAFIPLIYYLDVKWRAKKHRQLQELADALARMVPAPEAAPSAAEITEPTASASSVSQATPSEARIDSALLDDETSSENTADGGIRIYQSRDRS